MSTQPHRGHISSQFDVELETVRQQLLAMGGLVEQQVADAIRALTERNPGLGEAVNSRETAVNQFELDLDNECCIILARRQPAAGDLRLVYAVIKASTDLERIGDEALKIAAMAEDLFALDTGNVPTISIEHLAAHVSHKLRSVLDAFARMDVDAAFAAVRECETVDREYEALIRQWITSMMEDPRSIRQVIDLLGVVRALERIEAHARAIADYVFYLVRGKDVRHASLEDLERELQVQAG